MTWAKSGLLLHCNAAAFHQNNLIRQQITPNRPSNQEKEEYLNVVTKQLPKQPTDPFPQTDAVA